MKLKKIDKKCYTTIIDRLTRFEPAKKRYSRVFDDIINKFSDFNLKNLSLKEKIELADEIFNFNFKADIRDEKFHFLMSTLENKYFNFDEVSYQYLSKRINISQMIDEIEINEKTPKNVIWLKSILNSDIEPETLRNKHSLLYPIEKIILVEGETERILLKTLLLYFNINCDKSGFYIFPAGGKNQSARKYYEMIENCKIPIFILLDKDAIPTKELIEPKLREQDFIYIIQSGEFEDLIPKEILVRTINSIHKNEFNCKIDDFESCLSTVHNLENIYKKYGFGEFKKAHFALYLKEYIKMNSKCDFSNSEIKQIAQSLCSVVKC